MPPKPKSEQKRVAPTLIRAGVEKKRIKVAKDPAKAYVTLPPIGITPTEPTELPPELRKKINQNLIQHDERKAAKSTERYKKKRLEKHEKLMDSGKEREIDLSKLAKENKMQLILHVADEDDGLAAPAIERELNETYRLAYAVSSKATSTKDRNDLAALHFHIQKLQAALLKAKNLDKELERNLQGNQIGIDPTRDLFCTLTKVSLLASEREMKRGVKTYPVILHHNSIFGKLPADETDVYFNSKEGAGKDYDFDVALQAVALDERNLQYLQQKNFSEDQLEDLKEEAKNRKLFTEELETDQKVMVYDPAKPSLEDPDPQKNRVKPFWNQYTRLTEATILSIKGKEERKPKLDWVVHIRYDKIKNPATIKAEMKKRFLLKSISPLLKTIKNPYPEEAEKRHKAWSTPTEILKKVWTDNGKVGKGVTAEQIVLAYTPSKDLFSNEKKDGYLNIGSNLNIRLPTSEQKQQIESKFHGDKNVSVYQVFPTDTLVGEVYVPSKSMKEKGYGKEGHGEAIGNEDDDDDASDQETQDDRDFIDDSEDDDAASGEDDDAASGDEERTPENDVLLREKAEQEAAMHGIEYADDDNFADDGNGPLEETDEDTDVEMLEDAGAGAEDTRKHADVADAGAEEQQRAKEQRLAKIKAIREALETKRIAAEETKRIAAEEDKRKLFKPQKRQTAKEAMRDIAMAIFRNQSEDSYVDAAEETKRIAAEEKEQRLAKIKAIREALETKRIAAEEETKRIAAEDIAKKIEASRQRALQLREAKRNAAGNVL